MPSGYFSVIISLRTATLRGITDLGVCEGEALCRGPWPSLSGAWGGGRTVLGATCLSILLRAFGDTDSLTGGLPGSSANGLGCSLPTDLGEIGGSGKLSSHGVAVCGAGSVPGISSCPRAFDRREPSPPSAPPRRPVTAPTWPPSASLLGKG